MAIISDNHIINNDNNNNNIKSDNNNINNNNNKTLTSFVATDHIFINFFGGCEFFGNFHFRGK